MDVIAQDMLKDLFGPNYAEDPLGTGWGIQVGKKIINFCFEICKDEKQILLGWSLLNKQPIYVACVSCSIDFANRCR